MLEFSGLVSSVFTKAAISKRLFVAITIQGCERILKGTNGSQKVRTVVRRDEQTQERLPWS